MTVEYDEFRRTSWDERIDIFSRLSAAQKAELFRSQIAGWLQRHSEELTPPQVDILEEAIQLVVPEMYIAPESEELVAKVKDLERRALNVLTPAQVIDALTMQWGVT